MKHTIAILVEDCLSNELPVCLPGEVLISIVYSRPFETPKFPE